MFRVATQYKNPTVKKFIRSQQHERTVTLDAHWFCTDVDKNCYEWNKITFLKKKKKKTNTHSPSLSLHPSDKPICIPPIDLCWCKMQQPESVRTVQFSISMQTQKPMKPASGLSVDASQHLSHVMNCKCSPTAISSIHHAAAPQRCWDIL